MRPTRRPYNKRAEFKTRNKQQVYISDPIIDRITLIIQVPNKGDAELIQARLVSEGKLEKVLSTNKRRYAYSVEITAPSNCVAHHRETIWIGVYPDGQTFRVQYSPAKVADGALQLFYEDVLQGTSFNTLYDFICLGKVTYLEVCRNLFNVDLENYLIRGKSYRVHGMFGTPRNRTWYMGSEKSNRLRAYNKQKQDPENYVGYGPVGRIERVLRKLNRHVVDLSDLPDPLERVEMFSLDLSKTDFLHPKFHNGFKAMWRLDGINAALEGHGFSKNEARAAIYQLEKYQWQPWQDVQENWKNQWIETLKRHHLYKVSASSDLLKLEHGDT